MGLTRLERARRRRRRHASAHRCWATPLVAGRFQRWLRWWRHGLAGGAGFAPVMRRDAGAAAAAEVASSSSNRNGSNGRDDAFGSRRRTNWCRWRAHAACRRARPGETAATRRAAAADAEARLRLAWPEAVSPLGFEHLVCYCAPRRRQRGVGPRLDEGASRPGWLSQMSWMMPQCASAGAGRDGTGGAGLAPGRRWRRACLPSCRRLGDDGGALLRRRRRAPAAWQTRRRW